MARPNKSFSTMPPSLVPLLSVAALVVALAYAIFTALQFWARETPPPTPSPLEGRGLRDHERQQTSIEGVGSNARSWIEATFLAVVSAAVLTGWLATGLATVGLFSLTTLAVTLGVMTLLSGLVAKSFAVRPRFVRSTRHESLLVALLLLCTLLYFRPHDYLLAGIDPGSYVNLAAAVAETGRFANQGDPAWTALVTEHAALTGHYVDSHSYQFLGWYAESTPLVDGPSVVPQFFPFHPALMAVAIAVGDALQPLLGIPALGLKLGLRVTPLWGVLGVAAIFYLGRTLFSANVGLLAAGLLALSPLQIYFARYPTTEPLTLLLIFCALWGFQQLWEGMGSGEARPATTHAADGANHQPDDPRKISPLLQGGRAREGSALAPPQFIAQKQSINRGTDSQSRSTNAPSFTAAKFAEGGETEKPLSTSETPPPTPSPLEGRGLQGFAPPRANFEGVGSATGFFTAATLGAALLTRIDLPLVVAFLLAFTALRWRQGRWSRGWTMFAATFTALATYAVASALLINDTYVRHTYGGVLPQLGGRNAVLVAVAGLALAGVALAIYPVVAARFPLRRLLDARPTRLALAGALIALSVYAYFIRPFTSERLDAQNWVRLGWYLTPLGLALATLGWAHILRRASLVRIGPVVLIGLLTTGQYVFRLLNNPVQIYGMRRYVPIVLPTLMLGTAVAILAPLAWRRGTPKRRAALSVALALALVVGMMWQGRGLFSVRELRGSVEQIAAIDALLGNDSGRDAIVLLTAVDAETDDGLAPSTLPDEIGVPLAFAFSHNVATLRYTQNQDGTTTLDPQALAALLADVRAYASERNLSLRLVSATPLPATLTTQLSASPVGSVTIDVPQLELTYRHFPRTIEHRQYPVDIYRVE